MIKKNAGVTLGEMVLFSVFLAIILGTSIFFFFLNSKDVQEAEKKYEWVTKTNSILDEVSLEIANSLVFEHPFSGTSIECFFRATQDSALAGLSENQEGFAFKDGKLLYLLRYGDETHEKNLGNLKNPLLINCKEGKFTRLAYDSLQITVSVGGLENTGFREFKRVINLRNQ